MRRMVLFSGMAALALVLLSGCISAPPVRTLPSPSSHVKGPTSIGFDEIVIAAPVEGAHQVYQNLHVGLAAFINPRATAASAPAHLEGLVRGLAPRVSAATVVAVTENGTLSPHKLGALREGIVSRAQRVVNQCLAQWNQAPGCEVEVVLVSLYFTDSSVGRSVRREPEL